MSGVPTPDLDHDPARLALLHTARRPLPIEDLSQILAEVAEHQRRAHVERRGDRYSWNVFHAGGPYPLLREVASFLRADHTKLLVGGQAAEGGGSTLMINDGVAPSEPPDSWAVISLPRGSTPETLAARIEKRLGTR